MQTKRFGRDIAYYHGDLVRWIVDMPTAHLVLPQSDNFIRSDFKPVTKELTKLKAKHGIGAVQIHIGEVVEKEGSLVIRPLKTRDCDGPTFKLEDIQALMFEGTDERVA